MNQSKSYPVDVSSAEQILGYHFRKPSLLEHALTHGSSSNGTISYQRLEFVGDAALYLAMANYLNLSYPNLREGDMSRLRSANVSNEKLARVAVRHNIYPLVRINCRSLDKKVKKFIEAVKQEPEDEIYGGSTQKAPKILADVVEAIAAAIYQDCNNLDKMWETVRFESDR
ncbi:ribonuclease 3-like protein 2-like isoform X3 [Carex littledalei]|uniref:Ribonuclease 3-like protein 2-like isoform X3 n=1 Tax=Carex littledalei TaxID=544730 RepID=A0A833RSJ4_9POAL|nr:ribonuclease 3-like protein 2-like isoform X3 [Carex littledalei]